MFRTRSLKAHLSQIQCIDKHVDHANGVALRLGTAFAETDLDRANYEATVADLMAGQHDDPLPGSASTPRPTAPRMCRMLWHRKCCAVSTLKRAACRQGWKTSLIATSARIARGNAAPHPGTEIMGVIAHSHVRATAPKIPGNMRAITPKGSQFSFLVLLIGFYEFMGVAGG